MFEFVAPALLLSITLAGDLKQVRWTKAKATAEKSIDNNADEIRTAGRKIWEFAEPAFQEFQSSELLASTLELNGFQVKRGVAGMKTAFVAEKGSGKPVIAILAEFDALPGLAQDAVPRREPLPRGGAGHGCGHNLFGAASAYAAIATAEAIAKNNYPGTIRLYGCPAEEGGGGKVYMVREGLFRDVDVAIHWHPSTGNDARMNECLAVLRFHVRFQGKAAHASASPHLGRSALDGVELMNVGVNYLREHIPSRVRIHYVIVNGGQRPNVVPEVAEAWYYVRAPKMAEAQSIYERVAKIAEGAGLMSETTPTIEKLSGTYEMLSNEALSRVMDSNLRTIGAPPFSDEDVAFAKQLRESLGLTDYRDLQTGATGPVDRTIRAFGLSTGGGSTDVGDVSWNVPTTGVYIATAGRDIASHAWPFVACSGASIGGTGSITAAKVMAATAIELIERPEVVADAKAEFERRRAAAHYKPVIQSTPPERLEVE